MRQLSRRSAPATSLAQSKRPARRFVCLASNSTDSTNPRTSRLRTLLARPGILLGPAAYDGLSAKLTEDAGFDFGFMSGFSVAGARLGLPDTGLVSYGEMVEQGRQMVEATSHMPLIGDGDTGGGNAMNVKRTVKGYAAAGFSGILIEDQVWPKSCGHVRGKRVVSREEAVARVKAACDARDEAGGCGIVIVARTDAKQAVGFQEALERAELFAEVGADIVFVDALESVAEMRTLCARVGGSAGLMANMLEGGGKTPILSPKELEEMGFKLVAYGMCSRVVVVCRVALVYMLTCVLTILTSSLHRIVRYPLSLLGVSMNAMRRALGELKRGQIPADVPEFSDLQRIVGFDRYFEEEAKYEVRSQAQTSPSQYVSDDRPQPIEPDAVIEGDVIQTETERMSSATTTFDVTERPGSRSSGSSSSGSSRGSMWLRIRVWDKRNNNVALDTRFPAGFLSGISSIVPQVAGIDLGAILAEAEGKKGAGEPVYAFELDDERIEIYLEDL